MSNFRAIEKPIIDGLENPTGKQVPVLFYERAVYNEEESKKQGRPVYENRIYVRKHYDNLTCYDNRAEQSDFQQYARQYQRFMDTKGAKESGIPVGMLPGIAPAQAKICEDIGLVTVERLADCEAGMESIVGDLKARALAYLDQGKALEMLKEENAALKAKIAKLEGATNEPVNNNPKRRGRKPAVREADNGHQQQQQSGTAGAQPS